MNIEAYKMKLKALEARCQAEKINIMKAFVKANNPYMIGDVIRDEIGKIVIESISYSWGSKGKPYAIYEGRVIRPDGTYRKNGVKRRIIQPHVYTTY
jgi:hypothetical protein